MYYIFLSQLSWKQKIFLKRENFIFYGIDGDAKRTCHISIYVKVVTQLLKFITLYLVRRLVYSSLHFN